MPKSNQSTSASRAETPDLADIDFSLIQLALRDRGPMIEQILTGLQYGSSEVRQLILHESDFIMECRVCRNMFRALPNFIAHKRIYCRNVFGDPANSIPQGDPLEDTVVIQPEGTENIVNKELYIFEETNYNNSVSSDNNDPNRPNTPTLNHTVVGVGQSSTVGITNSKKLMGASLIPKGNTSEVNSPKEVKKAKSKSKRTAWSKKKSRSHKSKLNETEIVNSTDDDALNETQNVEIPPEQIVPTLEKAEPEASESLLHVIEQIKDGSFKGTSMEYKLYTRLGEKMDKQNLKGPTRKIELRSIHGVSNVVSQVIISETESKGDQSQKNLNDVTDNTETQIDMEVDVIEPASEPLVETDKVSVEQPASQETADIVMEVAESVVLEIDSATKQQDAQSNEDLVKLSRNKSAINRSKNLNDKKKASDISVPVIKPVRGKGKTVVSRAKVPAKSKLTEMSAKSVKESIKLVSDSEVKEVETQVSEESLLVDSGPESTPLESDVESVTVTKEQTTKEISLGEAPENIVRKPVKPKKKQSSKDMIVDLCPESSPLESNAESVTVTKEQNTKANDFSETPENNVQKPVKTKKKQLSKNTIIDLCSESSALESDVESVTVTKEQTTKDINLGETSENNVKKPVKTKKRQSNKDIIDLCTEASPMEVESITITKKQTTKEINFSEAPVNNVGKTVKSRRKQSSEDNKIVMLDPEYISLECEVDSVPILKKQTTKANDLNETPENVVGKPAKTNKKQSSKDNKIDVLHPESISLECEVDSVPIPKEHTTKDINLSEAPENNVHKPVKSKNKQSSEQNKIVESHPESITLECEVESVPIGNEQTTKETDLSETSEIVQKPAKTKKKRSNESISGKIMRDSRSRSTTPVRIVTETSTIISKPNIVSSDITSKHDVVEDANESDDVVSELSTPQNAVKSVDKLSSEKDMPETLTVGNKNDITEIPMEKVPVKRSERKKTISKVLLESTSIVFRSPKKRQPRIKEVISKPAEDTTSHHETKTHHNTRNADMFARMSSVNSMLLKKKKPVKREDVIHPVKSLKFSREMANNPNIDAKRNVCLICSFKFSSIKTLYYHMKTKHSSNRRYWLCPECSGEFVHIWGLTRHLKFVHNFTYKQVEKTRKKLHASSFVRIVDDEGLECKQSVDGKEDNTKPETANNDEVAEIAKVTEGNSELSSLIDMENEKKAAIYQNLAKSYGHSGKLVSESNVVLTKQLDVHNLVPENDETQTTDETNKSPSQPESSIVTVPPTSPQTGVKTRRSRNLFESTVSFSESIRNADSGQVQATTVGTTSHYESSIDKNTPERVNISAAFKIPTEKHIRTRSSDRQNEEKIPDGRDAESSNNLVSSTTDDTHGKSLAAESTSSCSLSSEVSNTTPGKPSVPFERFNVFEALPEFLDVDEDLILCETPRIKVTSRDQDSTFASRRIKMNIANFNDSKKPDGDKPNRIETALHEESHTEESSTEKSGAEESSTEKSGNEHSSTEKSGTEESSTEKSGAEESSTEKSCTEESSTEKSGKDTTSPKNVPMGSSSKRKQPSPQRLTSGKKKRECASETAATVKDTRYRKRNSSGACTTPGNCGEDDERGKDPIMNKPTQEKVYEFNEYNDSHPQVKTRHSSRQRSESGERVNVFTSLKSQLTETDSGADTSTSVQNTKYDAVKTSPRYAKNYTRYSTDDEAAACHDMYKCSKCYDVFKTESMLIDHFDNSYCQGLEPESKATYSGHGSVKNEKDIFSDSSDEEVKPTTQPETQNDTENENDVVEEIWIGKSAGRPVERLKSSRVYVVDSRFPHRKPVCQAQDTKKIDALMDDSGVKCRKCGECFASIPNLRRHVIRHLGWRRFQCSVCQYKCYNRSECKSHMNRTHKSIYTYADVIDLNKEASKVRFQKKQQTLSARQMQMTLMSAMTEARPFKKKSRKHPKDDDAKTSKELKPSPSKPKTLSPFNISTRSCPREFDVTPYNGNKTVDADNEKSIADDTDNEDKSSSSIDATDMKENTNDQGANVITEKGDSVGHSAVMAVKSQTAVKSHTAVKSQTAVKSHTAVKSQNVPSDSDLEILEMYVID